jgi:hypothetical protein
METPRELAAKLAGYQQQLASIEELLAADPNNPQILKLKQDLHQVIALTEDLASSTCLPSACCFSHSLALDPRQVLKQIAACLPTMEVLVPDTLATAAPHTPC